MSEFRVDIDIGYPLHVGLSAADILTYRITKNIVVSDIPGVFKQLNNKTSQRIDYLVNDIRQVYPSIVTKKSSLTTTTQKVAAVEFIPIVSINPASTITYTQIESSLTYKISPFVHKLTNRVYQGASLRHYNVRTQQSEVLQQLIDLQNSQPLSFKVLRKVEDTSGPGTGPEVVDKHIPLGLDISYDSYVGFGSPTDNRFSTISNNEDNTDQYEYSDGSILKIDQSVPQFRLITGKNDVQISLQVNPTYVVSKRVKD